jgi:23S rRNA (uracil1939-C5)-methyltransferase
VFSFGFCDLEFGISLFGNSKKYSLFTIHYSLFLPSMGKRRNKNFLIENLTVTNYAADGKCIIRTDEKVIFVTGAVPGDVVDVFVTKNKKDWAEGFAKTIHTLSPNRVPSFCKHFGICGGCKWQMLPYETQLQYKQQQVKDAIERIANIKTATHLPIKGCAIQKEYRNKLEFTFSNKRYLTTEEIKDTELSNQQNVVGYHAPKFFDKVIDIEHCHLQIEPCNIIRNGVRAFALQHNYSFFDLREHKGLLRLMTIRTSTMGETLMNMVFGENDMLAIENVMQYIANTFTEITCLYYTINLKANDSIYDQTPILYKGNPNIKEKLGEYVFNISPKSFFQTNTTQAVELYNITKQFAGLTGTETVYDLYCGTGSIGIYCSADAGKIIGVETIEDAIEDAKENAKLNNITNAQFFAGDVINICNDNFFKTHGKPDVVITDPPRAGMHTKLIEKLLEIKAPKIVYVSCNPATQARDLFLLKECYDVVQVQAVDMFPQTHHVESVALLVLRDF